MKKSPLILILFILTVNISFAQNKRILVGPEYCIPTSDEFKNSVDNGYGGAVTYEYSPGQYGSVTASVGYKMFKGKKTESNPLDIETELIPIQLGTKFYFNPDNSGLYLGAELGANILMTENKTQSAKGYFSYSPEIGFYFKNFDLGAYLQTVTTSEPLTFVGIRLSYAIALGKK